MTPRTRELIFAVMDGQPDLLPTMYQFAKFKYCDHILAYFIKEKWTGKQFKGVFENNFKNSWLTMGKYAIMKIQKDTNMKPIYNRQDGISHN